MGSIWAARLQCSPCAQGRYSADRDPPCLLPFSPCLPAHLQAAVAREVLRFAGLPVGEGPDSIQVINGLSGEVLPALRQLAGLPQGAAAGLVFLDHCKPVRTGTAAAVRLLQYGCCSTETCCVWAHR